MEQPSESTGAPSPTDRDGFTAWYADTLPRVYAYLFKATGGDRERAENIAQETFLQAVRTLQRGGNETVTVPWLLTVARSRMIDAARVEDRNERKLRLVGNTMAGNDRSTIDVSALDVAGLLSGLRPMERTVLALRYVDDLPVAEVASHIGRSLRATESLLARARRRLRDRVEEANDV